MGQISSCCTKRQRQADARNHVYSMRGMHADYIAARRERELHEKSTRVAYRDWERRQSAEKLMNVTHAKRLSSKLNSLGMSMTRTESDARRAQAHIATIAATKGRSDAERRAMAARRATMRSTMPCARRARAPGGAAAARRSASAASLRRADGEDAEDERAEGTDGSRSGARSTLPGSRGEDAMAWATGTPPEGGERRPPWGGGRAEAKPATPATPARRARPARPAGNGVISVPDIRNGGGHGAVATSSARNIRRAVPICAACTDGQGSVCAETHLRSSANGQCPFVDERPA